MAWSFDGSNDNVALAANAAVTFPDGDWSLVFKLAHNTGTWGADNHIVNLKPGGGHEFLLGGYNDGGTKIYLFAVDNDGTNFYIERSAGVMTGTGFFQIVVTRASGVFTIYVNNTGVANTTEAAFDAITADGAMFFGSNVAGSNFSNIRLAELAFFSLWIRASGPH